MQTQQLSLRLIVLVAWAVSSVIRVQPAYSPASPGSPDTTYWVSPDGQAAWTSCKGALPLNGSSACALSTANTNAVAGDTVYLRGGTYSNQEIRPSNSGTSDRQSHRLYEL